MRRDLMETLWHSLGMKRRNYRRSLEWWEDHDNHRNYYCAATGDAATVSRMNALVDLGFMQPGTTINNGECRYYHVTTKGVRVARSEFFLARKAGESVPV